MDKINNGFVKKLIALRDGFELTSSQFGNSSYAKQIRDSGVLTITRRARGTVVRILDKEKFMSALQRIDERFADLEQLLDTPMTRAQQASASGNSKTRHARTFPGFPVNSYEPIQCALHGEVLTIAPPEGTFVFVSNWQEFSIPEDVLVVGIENAENFRLIRLQRKLFSSMYPGRRILFVSRYPQSRDLRSWLSSIPNTYVHFGDFDLAGISIFINEFHKYIPQKSLFFIPPDIKTRIATGCYTRYVQQYNKFRALTSNDPALRDLIDTIHWYQKCYDQEGYIEQGVQNEERGK